MSIGPFASLHAGLLARKGGAKPCVEPPVIPGLRPASPAPAAPASGVGVGVGVGAGEVDWRAMQTPLAPHPAPAQEPPAQAPGADAPRTEEPQIEASRAAAPARASVRLTREQARALRLAALVLDRPQQELLAEGLAGRLEQLACGDLRHCACFRAVAAKLARD